MGRPRKPFEANYSEGEQDACWDWHGRVGQDGYGRFRQGFDGSDLRASRVVLERKMGRPIQPGMMALHTCHRPVCVNPNHLYEGTAKQNYDDMVRAGHVRLIRKEKRKPNRKHTPEQERAIAERYRAGGVTQQQIADEYGITQVNVSQIVRRNP